MNPKEIRDLTSEELEKRLVGLKEELFNLRFQLATGQLDNAMRVQEVRRSIARVMTTQREREIHLERA
jgi:large subunit ribosomal protein L29